MTMTTGEERINEFSTRILGWYRIWGRDLPWRGLGDPYAIWLSEVILQQTRIEQGRDYWLRFMARWPRVEDLAAASQDEVLREWQGLGYYSRARNLHAAARQIVEQGGFPNTYEGLRALKGVGDYTAAAVGSFAFGLPHAAVDGNFYRVLSRHYGIVTPINTTEGKKEFAALAQALLPQGHAAAFNQAMMDFGATWCTPKRPHCDGCPVGDTCAALHDHTVGQLPVKLKRAKVKTRYFKYVYMRCRGMTAVRRRPAGDIWQGLWEPLLIEDEPLPSFNGNLTLLKAGVKHVLTHRIIMADFYLLEAQEKPSLPASFIWIPEHEIEHYALPRLVEILLDSL